MEPTDSALQMSCNGSDDILVNEIYLVVLFVEHKQTDVSNNQEFLKAKLKSRGL